MKLTVDCKVCPCINFTESNNKYCVFRKPGGIVIVRDDPGKCSYVEETSTSYKNILEQYKMYWELKSVHKEA